MEKAVLYNTRTQEGIIVELSESMARDLDHSVLIYNYETYSIKNAIPESIKKLREVEQEFENKEFETIYTDCFGSPDSYETIADEFNKKFDEYFNKCIAEKYPDLNNVEQDIKDSVCLSLRTRFMAYFFKKQYEKNNEEDDKEITDKSFGIDYAHRLMKLFDMLSLDDPTSIQAFSQGLEHIENCMLSDNRRRAGFDALMLGITTSLQDVANVFISDPKEKTVNLVEAFKDTANNKDRDIVKQKLEAVIKKSSEYYKSFLDNVNTAITSISRVDSDKSMAYLRVECKMVRDFCANTNRFVIEHNELIKHTKTKDMIAQRRESYKEMIAAFCSAMDTLMIAFDSEDIPDSPYKSKVISAWKLLDDERSSENEMWYYSLMQKYNASWEDLFKCIRDCLGGDKKDS